MRGSYSLRVRYRSARTLQQDVEFGVIQIVDVALRAISPAINDPSTAISCIDQLSRILIRFATRTPPRTYLHAPPHVLRVVLPWIDFEGCSIRRSSRFVIIRRMTSLSASG